VPAKIKCDRASAVSAGWPKVVAEEVRAEPAAEAAAPRVDEDHGPEAGRRLPHRFKGRVGELAAVHVRRDADAPEPEFDHGAFQFADRQVRVLER